MSILNEIRNQYSAFGLQTEEGRDRSILNIVRKETQIFDINLKRLSEQKPLYGNESLVSIVIVHDDGKNHSLSHSFGNSAEYTQATLHEIMARNLELVGKPIFDLCVATIKARRLCQDGIEDKTISGIARDYSGIIEDAVEELTDAVNKWLATVADFKERGLVADGSVGKPLAINHDARNTHEIGNIIHDIGDRYKLISDTQAAILRITSREGRAPSVA